MDELDHNLLDAWDRVYEQCRRDPAEARRRYLRTLPGTTLDRPVRAWTVAVRASDTRIGDWNEPRALASGPESQTAPSRSRLVQTDPICAQAAHEIVLDGWSLRQLGGAVEIPYPGLPIDEAAKKLGKHKEALRNWMSARPGRTRAARAESAKGVGYDDNNMWFQEHPPTEQHPLGVRYVPGTALGRHFGMETPVVWSDGALDPGASKGRPPARWWGTLWRSLAENIPCEFEQVVERVPRWLPYGSRKRREGEDRAQDMRFRGWQWRCPGLLEEHGAGVRIEDRAEADLSALDPPPRSSSSACGRLVRTLYAPLPVWTVGRYLDLQEGLNVEGLSGQWYPGVMDRWAGRRSLACERCWKLQRTSFAGYRGWNELVTHLSGGLLYGREVEQPADFEYERKVVKRPRKRRQSEPQPAPRAVAKQAVGD
jgi:hypothetical protein